MTKPVVDSPIKKVQREEQKTWRFVALVCAFYVGLKWLT